MPHLDSLGSPGMAYLTNGTASDLDLSPFGEDVLTRPVDQAMLPFYHATNFFLREIIVRGSLKDLNATVNLADREAVRESLRNNWQMWIEHYLGYFLVFLFGILLALATVIGGIAFCCCRKKGHCGSRISPVESNRFIKYIRWICNTIFLIFSIILLLATVGTFVTSELTYEQTRQTGTTADILQSLANLNNYSLSTVENLAQIKEKAFDENLTEFYIVMDTFATDAQSDILRKTSIQESLNVFNVFLKRVPLLYDQLGYMESLAQSLTNDLNYLDYNITSIVREMEQFFRECSEEDQRYCIEALETAQSIQILKDYRTVSNVSEAREGIISATQGNFTLNNTMERTNEACNMIQYVIQNTTSPVIDKIYCAVDIMSDALDNFTSNTLEYIAPPDLQETLSYVNETLSINVATFDYYRYIAATILNSLILLIISMYFIALCFGACGSRAVDNAPCCNRGRGRHVIIAGVITSFAVTWIIILAAGLLLIVGGILSTEICNNLLSPEQNEDTQVLDYILTSRLNSSIKISTVMNNCKENQPFYGAFQIEERASAMNISNITNINSYNFQELFSSLGNLDYNISLHLIDDDSIALYDEVASSFSTVDPNTYFYVIEEDLTNEDLFSFAEYLNETSKKVADTSTANLFVYFSELFRATAIYSVPKIAAKEFVLQPIVDSAYDTLVFGFQEYVETMVERAETIDSEVLQAASVDHSQSAVPKLAAAADQTSQQFQKSGRCQTVYHSARTGVTSVCVKWLYPFNTYWWCLGCCFLFIFFSWWPAMYLDRLYRKIYKFNPERSNNIDRTNLQYPYSQESSALDINFQQPFRFPRTSALAIINPVYIPDPDYDEIDENGSSEHSYSSSPFSITALFKRKSNREQRISDNSVDISEDFF